jgi:hypothetical protein
VDHSLGTFDLIVLGFTPRKDLFHVVSAVDDVLAEDGHLAIFDVDPGLPRRRAYAYDAHVTTWKMNHAALFQANPQYLFVERRAFAHGDSDVGDADERAGTTLLRKISATRAHPEIP